MVQVAVAGGTGVVGRYVVEQLVAAGHQAKVLARATGSDLVTGAGLAEALDGVAVVVDVVNASVSSRKKSVEFFTRTTTNLLAAEREAGVRHHVGLSIIGVDRVDFGYYMGKRRQEQLVERGDVAWTILRAAQFHEFAQQLADRMPGPVVPVPRMRSQPVAAREVAALLVELALATPTLGTREIAGPEVLWMPDLVRRELRSRHSRRVVVPLRLPGAVGRGMANGELLPGDSARVGTETFSEWLGSWERTSAHGVEARLP